MSKPESPTANASGATPNPIVRVLTPNDAEACAKVRRALLLESPFSFSASPETDTAFQVSALREWLGASSETQAFGVFAPELMGIAVTQRERHAKGRHRVSILSVGVLSEARGRGFGRLLMTAVVEHAKSLDGVEVINLSVGESTKPARALYESLGFRVWGEEPDVVRVDGVAQTEIHMRLEVESD